MDDIKFDTSILGTISIHHTVIGTISFEKLNMKCIEFCFQGDKYWNIIPVC